MLYGRKTTEKGAAVNNSQLIAAIAVQTGLSQADAQKAITSFYDTVAHALRAGDAVAITNFGKFYVSKRSARNGRNPKTGATILIPASNYVLLKPSAALVDAVN